MIAMGSAESYIFVCGKLSPALKFVSFHIRIPILGSGGITKASLTIGDGRFVILVIQCLYLIIKQLVI